MLLLAFGCQVKAPETAAATYKEPVEAQVVRKDIAGFETIPGKTYTPPDEMANVYATTQAPVARVLATVGAKVRRGEVLIELSYPNAEAAYEQARLTVQAAQTAYDAAVSQYGDAHRAAKQTLDAARTREKEARALATEGVEGTDLQAATDARIAAEQEVSRAKADMDVEVLPYKQQLQAAEAEFKAAKAGAKLASIRAPISGILLKMDVKPGDNVGVDAKRPIATIVDLEALQVNAPVTAEQAKLVKEHKDVSLTFKGMPDQTFEGELWKVSNFGGGGAVRFEAVYDFKNDQGLIKPEMADVTVVVKVGDVKDVLAVPAEAVDRDPSGKTVVKVKKGSEWTVTFVEIGLTDGKYTEIKKGLSEGDTVLTTP